MSINSAMLAGVSGLISNSSALAAISDNIANVNTTAYKRNQVNFANVVTAQAVSGRYSAGGVQGQTHAYVGQQGLIQASNSPTDLAISGEGFFVVTDKALGLTPSDARKFTRAGAFSVDSNGFLVNNSNLYLQGWPIQPNGTFAIDPSDLTKLAPINIKNLGTAVKQTGNLGVTANLDAGTAVSGGAAAYSSAAGTSMADFAQSSGTSGTKPDFTIPMTMTDSLGGTRRMEMGFLKTGPNLWAAELYAVPDTDVTVGGAPGLIMSGDIAFNPDGTIDMTPTASGGLTTFPANFTLNNSATGAVPNWATALGLADQTVNLDLTKLSQQTSSSTVTTIINDGAGVGNVVSVQVDIHGVVSAIYDNSQVRQIAKVAVATFPDPDALKSVSGNAYQPTLQAGQMILKDPGIGGAGQISPSSLEASTVDLSAEFTGLISTQKAYSASSKIITTADQMLDQLINIIR